MIFRLGFLAQLLQTVTQGRMDGWLVGVEDQCSSQEALGLFRSSCIVGDLSSFEQSVFVEIKDRAIRNSRPCNHSHFHEAVWSDVCGEAERATKWIEPVTFPLSTKETRKYESGYEEIDGIVD